MTKRGFSDEVERFAAEINTSFEQRRPPHFEWGTVASWVAAVNLQMLIGQIEVAEHGVRHLRERFPAVTYANRVGEIFDRLPFGGTPLPFKDDPACDVQVAARERAETVLLLFCGRGDNLGLPLAVVHRWTGRLNASLIYLRDFRRHYFLEGVSSLGGTRDATIASLRGIVASLGAKRIVCYGGSAGVFGALHYGLDLQAAAILCAGGIVNLSPDFNAYTVYEHRANELQGDLSEEPPDLCRLYNAAPRRPRVQMIYGADYWDDRIHAEYMGTLPCVTLRPVENFGEHNVIVELIRRGQLETALHWLAPDSPTF
jgi:hypothetical protein